MHTKTVLLLFITLLLNVPALAQDHWSAQELDALGRELTANVRANGMAALPGLIDGGSYQGLYVFRQPGAGEAEQHAEWSDIYFVTAGSATLITGGSIIDPRPNPQAQGPGELVGPRIEGGTSRPIGEGDIVHIPPGIAHHLQVEAEDGITYFILKARPE